MKLKQVKQAGFTLIEMIVSLGLFSVVVTIAVGAILVLISTNQQLQKEQSVMTNLSFALDSMTREIRTGYNYNCQSYANYAAGGPTNIFNDSNNPESILNDNVNDCADGKSTGTNLHGVSFYEGGNSLTGTGYKRIAYFYDGTATGTIMRRVGDDDAESIVPSGVVIEDANFNVSGSDDLASVGDYVQPTVTIYIEAKAADDPSGKIYHLQTTVTQRTLDL